MAKAPQDPHTEEANIEVDLRDTSNTLSPAKNDPSEPIAQRGKVATYYALARVKFDYLLREAAKFGVVGIIALIIDVGLFNLLMYSGPLAIFAGKPLTAKIVAVAVAMTFAYFANRFWTFRDRGRTSMAREYVLFVVLNLVGMGIALACLWFSHYALGLTSALADNISANVVGLILGTLFRFWAYRKWVFPAVEDELATDLAQQDAQAS
ncbi:MAG: GtrA family protein [Candidatus Nanopelagicales bacterium]